MRRKLFLYIAFFTISIYSCSKYQKETKPNQNFLSIKMNTSVETNERLRKIFLDYINKNSQYKSFLLTYTPIKLHIEEVMSKTENFLLGPNYEYIAPDKTPILYFELNNKKIYIKCGIENLLINSNYQDSIFVSLQTKYGTDSIVNMANRVDKNTEVLYVIKSIYISVENVNNIYVNYRPDTLLFPKLISPPIEYHP